MRKKFIKNKLTVSVIILSVTFLVLISQSIKRNNVSLVENVMGVSFNSFQGAIYSLNSQIKYSLGFIFNYSAVKKDDELLRARNSELENMLIEYSALKDENKQLRGMMNFKDTHSEYNYIGCNIIGKSGNG